MERRPERRGHPAGQPEPLLCRNLFHQGDRRDDRPFVVGRQLERRRADRVGAPSEKGLFRGRLRIRLFRRPQHVRFDVHPTGLLSRGYSRIYAGPQNPRGLLLHGRRFGRAGETLDGRPARGVRSAELCQAQGPASQEHAARLRILARRDVPCGPFRRGRGLYRGHEQRKTRSRGDRLHTRIVSGFLRPRSGLRLAAALGEQRHAPHDQRRHGISRPGEYAGRGRAAAVRTGLCRCRISQPAGRDGRARYDLA